MSASGKAMRVVIDKGTHTNGQNRQDVARPKSRDGAGDDRAAFQDCQGGSGDQSRPPWARRAIAPGALKNAIDWASRPYRTNAFTRKPSAVIGTSPGKIGTAVAQQHLRSMLAFCNSPLMNSIEAYIQFEDGLIREDGLVANESTRAFLQNYMAEFHGFIARAYTVLPRNT